MLKTRVISAIIGAALLITIVSFGNIALGLGTLFLSLIGIHELYNAFSHAGYKPIKLVGYLSCAPIFFISFSEEYKMINNYVDLFKSINYASFGVFLIIVGLFYMSIFHNDRYNLNDISLTFLGILYVPFLFAFIVLTRNLEYGAYYIWIIFIGAFATDTFAYFFGVFLGKNKLIPAISPKKTVEGAIGGAIGCLAVTLAYGAFVNTKITGIPLYHFAIIGLLNGVISQIGDLAASSVKRFVNIKDYGRLMPGHGGVLDRFDSILFNAPVVYFYITFIVHK